MYIIRQNYWVIFVTFPSLQKDPGEYMLELQGFAALQPPEFQRYKIDMHLRRYASALNNLWRSGKQHFDAVSAVHYPKEDFPYHTTFFFKGPNLPSTAVLQCQLFGLFYIMHADTSKVML